MVGSVVLPFCQNNVFCKYEVHCYAGENRDYNLNLSNKVIY
jgi:hypothetical protein